MKKHLTLILALVMLLALVLPASAADKPDALTATAEAANIKKYGNVVLSLTCDEIKAAGYTFGDIVTVRFLERSLDLPFCSNYSDVDSGCPGLFARDEDTYVLAAINMGDFATSYGIALKTTYADGTFLWNYGEGIAGPVTFTISMKEAGGYYDEYIMHQLSYTDERADYPELTDAQFANFRAVTTTGMGTGILYRTASPVNPEKGRNAYADAALSAAGVTVVMNLVDDAVGIKAYEGYDTSYYATTEYITLSMDMDYSAAAFRSGLADGLRFFAANPGVYAVHCLEGKDRAGFVCALLECLMGAGYDEVVADYMTTYENYYGVRPDDPRYETIANGNIVKTLRSAFGVDDLESADLAAEAEEYMRAIGLTDAELSALKRNLSASHPFTDVALDAWYADAVACVYERGLMIGTGEAVFSPEAELTRAQFVTVLWRLAGEPAADRVLPPDVPEDSWYAEAVRWAAAQSPVDTGPYAPNAVLTREEAVALLWREARYLGADVGIGEETNILSYNDAFDVGEAYMPAMQWAVGSGVVEGDGAGNLNPREKLTRAQAAEMLMRFDAVLTEGQCGGPDGEIIPGWTADSAAMRSIVEFVKSSVDEGAEGYIPKADRIAVFDMDGTLCGERAPTYFNDWLFIWRALYDDSFEAPQELREFAQAWEDKVLRGIPIEDFDAKERALGPQLYQGLSPEAYAEVVRRFKALPVWGFTGMTYGEAYFQPMVSLVKFLCAHDYTVYIVSATYRDAVRVMTEEVLDEYIPADHVIGTDLLYVALGDEEGESMFYELEPWDELVIAGELFIKNQKTNKAVVIQREIGKVPVLAFGNSTGDFSMATYTLSNKKYPSEAYMLLCDDTERDYGDPAAAAAFKEKCDARGFHTVSMRDEFLTIYPAGAEMTASEMDGAA